MKGGFVGVDVFFVISGFLITGILFREIEAENFSLLKFYERRVRRIFPALFVVVCVVMLVGQWVLLPAEYVDLSRSAAFTALSAANYYFQFTINYFNSAAETKPLLHMWSLAVEEQFYLFFPLILLVLHRFAPKALRAALIAMMVLSFVAAVVWVARNPSAAFYGPQFRAWELMVGGMLAIFRLTPPGRAWLREALALLGMAGILGSIFLLKSSTAFPGLAAAPACIGAGLVIWSASRDRQTWISRTLSLPPVRFIGLISYSLYLWHWPIIVFLREGAAFSPISLPTGIATKLLAIALSLLFATLSWRFIERPFRTERKGVGPKAVVGAGAASIAACCAICGLVIVRGGFPERFPPGVQHLASYLTYDTKVTFRDGECFIASGSGFKDYNRAVCLTRKPGVVNYMLVGDSHAAQYWWGLSHELPESNVGQATASGCRNLLHQPVRAEKRCRETLGYAYSGGLDRFRPDVLILAGRWRQGDVAALRSTLDELKQRAPRVALIGPVPEYDAPLPKLLIAAQLRGDEGWPDRHLSRQTAQTDASLRRLAAEKGVLYLSPYADLCSTGRCRTESLNGDPVQFDYGHLTADGSRSVVREWRAQLIREGEEAAAGEGR